MFIKLVNGNRYNLLRKLSLTLFIRNAYGHMHGLSVGNEIHIIRCVYKILRDIDGQHFLSH